MTCEGRELLIQAEVDGELDVASAAELAAHIETCPECAALHAQLVALSRRLREEIGRAEAPAALRETLTARFAPIAPAPIAMPARRLAPRRFVPVLGFAGGFALAAAVMLAILPGDTGLENELIADHVRALQPGHLMDVASSDQHTVKPWFNGKLDYAPPVKDLAAAGFPLLGGRLDAVGNRTVGVMVYRSDKHLIDLFVWPAAAIGDVPTGSHDGFHVVGWSEDGMVFRAVSDVEAGKLADFARQWRSAS
ncbi:MAG TPA: anti-sigma factor [Acetobacteraceae bacterium]|jgi:anti-sigma factor RsiW|nr:anti-sigma factor [Acetobacteraceae bacterium]